MRRRPARLPGRSLRHRLRLLLLGAALAPTLALGAASLAVVIRLGAATAAAGASALEARNASRLQAQVQQAAQPLGAQFLAVEQQASVLAQQVQYILDNPALFPGDQQGNTPFTQLPDGDLVNTDPTVGVYAPLSALAQPDFWTQVSLLTHVDPLLRAMAGVSCCLPSVLRYWIQTPAGMIRVDPNPGFAAGVRMRPQAALLDYYAGLRASDLAAWQRTAWTLPYADPAQPSGPSPEVVSAVVPAYVATGGFAALAGADVSAQVLVRALQAAVQPPFSAAMLYRPVAAAGGDTPAAPYPVASSPGGLTAVRLAATSAAMPLPAAFGVPSGVAGVRLLGSGSGALEVAYAPVGIGGWMLAEAAPARAADGATDAARAVLARRAGRTRAVAAGLLAAVTVGLGIALVLIAERAAATVSLPLRRLAADIRGTAGDAADPFAGQADTAPGRGAPDPAGATRRAGRSAREADEVTVLTEEFADLRRRLRAAVQRWRREAVERARAEMAVLVEKQRIARDIHDTMAQAFLSIVLLSEGGAGRLAQVGDLARQGLRQARRGMADLAPTPQEREEEPFVQAVRAEAAGFPDSLPDGPAVELEAADWPELPLPTQVALLGVLRSALGNVREHAGARRVRIRLRGVEDAAILEVADDGAGFDAAALGRTPPDPERGRGLPGMRRRVAEVGGVLVVTSSPGRGTVVRAIVPRGGGDGPEAGPGANATPAPDGGGAPTGNAGSGGAAP